ncbi:MAG: hypothetical protein KC589_02770 [Nanoarchaeota archaeon]|nr:hypothetical protein [Nanoarchaeota archaeon]
MKNLIDLYKTDKETFKENIVNKLYELAKNNIEEKKKDIGNSILNYKKRD